MKIKVFRIFEIVLGWVAAHAEILREKVSLCPDCGANRYTGKPCKNLSEK